MALHELKVELSNSSTSVRRLVLEPYGGQYDLLPGHTYELLAIGDLEDPLSLELTDSAFIVSCFDSEGASVRILEDGVELRAE